MEGDVILRASMWQKTNQGARLLFIGRPLLSTLLSSCRRLIQALLIQFWLFTHGQVVIQFPVCTIQEKISSSNLWKNTQRLLLYRPYLDQSILINATATILTALCDKIPSKHENLELLGLWLVFFSTYLLYLLSASVEYPTRPPVVGRLRFSPVLS